MSHKSRSDEQQRAEVLILEGVNRELGTLMTPAHFQLRGNVKVQLDGIDEEARCLCEIYARIGRLKGSQPDKVASDLLKMQLVKETRGGKWRKVFAFADPDAAKILRGKSWLAAAVARLDVQVLVIDLPEEVRLRIRQAQSRQVMVNVK